MRKTSISKHPTLAPAVKKQLDKLSNYLTGQLKKEPAEQQQKFMSLLLWKVDHENQFYQLCSDIVDVMVFISKQMTTTASETERRKQYSYLVMLRSLYRMFNDLESNNCSIFQE